ncbi:MAG: ABC transporter substrate-binding protein [Methylotenera sp.]|jgi:peptide/nickel transport system substrate-binding protein|nr:ABC transporter substrate-binding protein [Methylotenera sp.]
MFLIYRLLSALLLCLLLSLSACKPGDPSASASHALVFAISQAPLNLDPRYATDAASERLNRLLYQSLVVLADDGKPLASLAAWQQLSPLIYRFTLIKNRPAFHYHQTAGQKSKIRLVNAYDVKATYDSLITLSDSPHSAEFSNVKNIIVQDEVSLLFHLKKEDGHFPAKLLLGILPVELIKKRHDFAHFPVGSGPLVLLDSHNKWRLQRISDGQRITLIEVKDPTVRMLKLLHAEVDLIQGDLPPESVRYLQSKPTLQVKTSEGVNFSYLGLNMQDAQLKQLKVRQALAHAIDREAIIKKAMLSHTRLGGAILPPEHYLQQQVLPAYRYDPALARRLLLEAGVSLPMKLVYKTSTDAQRVRLATILQAQMRTAGIDLEIRSLDWATFFAEIKHGNFQLYGLTWVGVKTPAIYSQAFASSSVPPHGFNRGRYQDAVLDPLLIKEDWLAVTQRIHQQLPYIPLWYEGQFAAMGKSIQNYSPKADGNWDDLATISAYAH